MPGSFPTEHLDAAEQALDHITEKAGSNHKDDPKAHIHAPSNHDESHGWMRSIFPYSSLQELENAWHMGNYVLDRDTGTKSFEEMSIYVRVSRDRIFYM
jgi:phosphatidylserine decarboxylase